MSPVLTVKNQLPISLSLRGLPCLVVGGGPAASERVTTLLECGAQVRWVGADSGLPETDSREGVEARSRPFEPTDLDGVWLVVLTDQDAQLAERVGEEARARRVFYCAVDQPAYNTFAHMALTRVGALTIAVGTRGAAPALARRLQTEFARIFGTSAFLAYVDRIVALRARLPREGRREKMTAALARLRLEAHVDDV